MKEFLVNNIKNVFSIGLLLFVAAAVVTAVVKQSGESPEPENATTSLAETMPANGLVATFFHGDVRCPTCRNIESYAHQAIEEGFADQLASGDLQWQTTNYETPANKHFADDYEIFSSTVVLVRMADGKPADWRNLNRVWEFVGDEQAFKGYVVEQAQEMLEM
jgi:hypothetical protein